jgi:hypothetical protein
MRTWRRVLGATTVAALCSWSLAALDDGPATAAPSTGAPVIVIGDSVVADGMTHFLEEFAAVGFGAVFIDAQGGREIERSGPAPWGWVVSGLDRINALKSTGADAPLWVIELGANNLPRLSTCGCDRVAESRRLINVLRSAIGPRTIVWATTRYETFHEASLDFNAALWSIAAEDPTFHVVDWFTHSAGEDWFNDAVHTNATGAHALARCLSRSSLWLTSVAPPPPTVPTGVLLPAQRLGRTGHDLPPCPVV